MSIPDCEFQLRSSRAYVSLSLFLHAGGIAAVWGSRLEGVPALVLSALVLAGLWRDLRHTGLRHARGAVRALMVRHERFHLRRNDGPDQGPVRLRTARMLDGAVLLRFAGQPWQQAVVVVPADCLSGEAFRQLRIVVGAALTDGAQTNGTPKNSAPRNNNRPRNG